MIIREITDEYADWDAYVGKSKAASIYHHAGWQDVIKDSFGHDCHYIYATDSNERIVGVLPLVHIKSAMFGNYVVSLPFFNYGGLLADDGVIKQKLVDAAIEYAEKSGASHIEIRSDAEVKGLALPVREDKVSMRLTLPDQEEELWKDIGSKLRAQIKRPLREGATVRVGGKELIREFYSVFSQNMRDLGTPVYGMKLFSSIMRHFEEYCNIVLVQVNQKSVAAGFLIHHAGMTEIPWASSLREYNRIGVNMLMYWESLKLSIEKNSHVFDFGRSSQDSGTFKFKKQWGASPHQLYWYYWLRDGGDIPILNPTNPKYQLAIKTWQKLPLCVANLIGPSVVKNLP